MREPLKGKNQVKKLGTRKARKRGGVSNTVASVVNRYVFCLPQTANLTLSLRWLDMDE